MKTCKVCGQLKPLTDFNKQSKSRDKHSSYCRKCANTLVKQWRVDNKEYRKTYTHIYERSPQAVARRKKYRDSHRELYYNLGKEFATKNPERILLYEARKRAKHRGVPFSITYKDIVIPEFCPVLGIKLYRGVGHLTDASPTIDAIIPEKGYVKGNIAVISHRANRHKSDATLAELKALVSWLERTTEEGMLSRAGIELPLNATINGIKMAVYSPKILAKDNLTLPRVSGHC